MCVHPLHFGIFFTSPVQAGKIFGGRKADPHSRPYMVLLELKTFQGTTIYCDGFLISNQFVVTAAHCQAR
jgi:mast cell peptidase 1